MNRRSFVSTASLAGLGLFAGSSSASAAKTTVGGREIAVFTKFLEKLSYDELAAAIAPLGITGLEAPLRKGGHIEPEELSEKLPRFVKTLGAKDLKVVIMASSINSVDRKGISEKQLRAASDAGVKKYRLQHLKYDLSKPIKPQMANFKAQLTDLAALNKETGIQGLYQNHRGSSYVGGPIWDMLEILEDIDPAHLGLAFDFAHATVEGTSTWEMNFHRALPHIGAVFFKDYKLVGKKWEACPLGQGAVNPKSGKLVSKMLPKDIPISVHIEYRKSGSDIVRKNIEAMSNDIATVKKWL